MSSESEHGWVLVLAESHPSSHGVDDVLISVHSSVHSLLPVATISSVISTGVLIVGLAEGHGLGASVTVLTDALGAITQSVWESCSSVVHEGVGRQECLDLPVTISSREELSLKASMHVDVLIFDKDGSLISHISGRGTWVLVIMAIVLGHKSL